MESPPDAVWRDRMRRVLDQEPPGAHLSEDAWQALAERRPLSGDAGEALEHLARCAECRDVVRAMHLLHSGRERVEADARVSGRSKRIAWAAAIAAMVTAGGGVWMVTTAPGKAVRSEAVGVASPASSEVPAAAAPRWLRLTAPPMAIYSPEALTMRGETGAPFAEAFATAMQPWQAGRFAEAAQGLAVVTATHPTVAEGHFYRGVALLLSGTPGDAIAPLERATAMAPDRLAPDAWWYLGLARYQQGDRGEAAAAFARACGLGRPSTCDAAQALSPPTDRRP